jgi:hypothetical protein
MQTRHQRKSARARRQPGARKRGSQSLWRTDAGLPLQPARLVRREQPRTGRNGGNGERPARPLWRTRDRGRLRGMPLSIS